MKDFVMGSVVWPGLSKVIEEAGEVIQVCAKLMQRPTGEHWSGDLNTMLVEEVGDLYATLDFLVCHNKLDFKAINERRAMKWALFEQWHAENSEARTQ